ncbi:MAG TPA: PfkB family carbohydrate kinase, partial [Streptomyces sp.]|uniref:1-phosphofructokinase family hexose kinase n=1 Tax=Streptomyces sp. TaxID=1931 RepID=UPI002D2F4E98
MILTVTPDPGPDRTYGLPAPARGAVLRAGADRVDPGGKGVNVSRAVVPLGGPEGEQLARLLGERGIEAAGVPIAGSTRVNITLVEPDGTLTKVNAAGPEISGAEAEALPETARARSADADWIACCGSLPRGLRPEWYAELVRRVHRAGARIALDTSGRALTAALGERPDVVKPNAGELAEAVG